MVVRFKLWLREDRKWENWLLVLLVVMLLFFSVFVLFTDRVLYQGDGNSSSLYLLSSIIQGLATILALLLTASLIAGQLAAGAYTPRVISHRLTDFWLWTAILIYLGAIGWSLFVLGAIGRLPVPEQEAIDISLLMAGFALIYIIPFTAATIRGLQPGNIAKWIEVGCQ